MPGRLIVTPSPTRVVQACLDGRELITPGSLAALTWRRAPCTLHDVIARAAGEALINDAQALALLGDEPAGPAPATLHQLDAVRTVLGAPHDPQPHALEGPLSQLLTLSTGYAARLRERDLVDPALPARLPVVRPPASPVPLLIHGYTSLTTIQAQWLTLLSPEGSVLVLPQLPSQEDVTATCHQLLALGWHLEPEDAPTEPPPPQYRVHRASDRLHEARSALAQAADCLSRAQGPVLLTARVPESYRTELAIAASELDLPLHFHAMTTVQDRPGGRLLGLIAQVLTGQWAYDDVCTLLDSPACPPLTSAQWARIRKTGAASQAGWRELLPLPLRTLSDLPAQGTPMDWYLALRDALPEASAAELLFELTPLLETRLPAACDQHLYGAALAQVVRGQRRVSPTLPPDHLIVAAPQELLGAQANLVLVLGLSDGVWPAPPQFHAPLDAHERLTLARASYPVATAVTHAREERLLLEGIGSIAPTVVASFPQIVNGSLRPVSPLLADQPYHDAPLPDPGTPDLPPAPTGAGAVFERERPPFDLFDLQLSPTQLTRFGQCAFRWYAQHGLRLDERDEPSLTLAPHRRGRLYHLTLEHVARALQEAPERPDGAELDQLLAAGFEQAEAGEEVAHMPHWRWERGEHLRHLQELLSAPEFLPEGHRLHAAEQEFTLEWHGLTVRGTLDRLDQAPDGFVVTDYKTGTSAPPGAQGEDGRLNLDVQLALYLAAASQLTGTPVTAGRYLSLTRRDRRTLAVAEPDEPALLGLAQAFTRAVDQGLFPVRPDPGQRACQHCPYTVLCRQTEQEGDVHDE